MPRYGGSIPRSFWNIRQVDGHAQTVGEDQWLAMPSVLRKKANASALIC